MYRKKKRILVTSENLGIIFKEHPSPIPMQLFHPAPGKQTLKRVWEKEKLAQYLETTTLDSITNSNRRYPNFHQNWQEKQRIFNLVYKRWSIHLRELKKSIFSEIRIAKLQNEVLRRRHLAFLVGLSSGGVLSGGTRSSEWCIHRQRLGQICHWP